MLAIDRKYYLNFYIFLCFALFAALFYYNAHIFDPGHWIAIIVFGILAAVFDYHAILLPSGEDLTLVTPLLFTAGVLYGVLPVFWIVAIMAVILAVIDIKRWTIPVFNCLQYGLSAYAALLAYNFMEIAVTSVQLQEILPWAAYALTYFVTNVLLISGYFFIRDGAEAAAIIKDFFESKSLIIYFTIMALGFLMSIVIEAQGIVGIVVFAIVLWCIGYTYRNYYEMYNHFHSLSFKDELTGLYNHRHFQEELQKLVEKEQTVSLLLMDIDHFKLYNDMFGHVEGDGLLKGLAALLKSQVGEEGIVCRYAGDEFAIILYNKDADEAKFAAENIRAAVSNHEFNGKEHMPSKNITISIGVAVYPQMADTKENLILLADEALYKVKYTTHNKVQVYASIMDELTSVLKVEPKEQELLSTIKTFLAIINGKDQYTYGHTERLMEYAEVFSGFLGLSPEEKKYLRYGALLHDIGKVEVPTEILVKRSPLTDGEWQIMKDHVVWGEKIVEPIKELKPCLEIIRHHHERYDGRGYPDGLTGETIPMGARILTIIDSFDAMTSKRPYQRKKDIAEAVAELQRHAGKQFDPALVEAFLKVVNTLWPKEYQLEESREVV